jgi:spermidine synthase
MRLDGAVIGNLPAGPAKCEAPMDQRSSETVSLHGAVQRATSPFAAFVIYLMAFVVGAVVMSFEMLGSRYLNPYFGSGIYTWASLISTVLAALTVGYFIGGWLADRRPTATVLGATVLIGSGYLLLLPGIPIIPDALAIPGMAQPLLEFLLAGIDDVRSGSLIASMAILFFPVTFLGMYSPFAIRLLLRSALTSGTVSGTVYGVSTAGSIVGTLGTTFYLIPMMGTRNITLTLGLAGVLAGLVLMALPKFNRRAAIAGVAGIAALALLTITPPALAQTDKVVDEALRAEVLKKRDGRIDHVETEYNDIFINKRRHELTMSFQRKGWFFTESVTNLRDPDELVVPYSRFMTVSLAYAENPKKILMVGLGGGSISTYLGRFMPEASIDTVELDPGVIAVAKKYFGILETPRMRYFAGDGRVYLNRNKQTYDLILLDAFYGSYIPFHLLTKEFYTLLKERLAPGGAIAFNSHDHTKLFISTVKTLSEIFPTLDLYPSGEGETVIVVSPQKLDADMLGKRAAQLQAQYRFRYSLPEMLAKRDKNPLAKGKTGVVLTDDFSPVSLYDQIGPRPQKKP